MGEGKLCKQWQSRWSVWRYKELQKVESWAKRSDSAGQEASMQGMDRRGFGSGLCFRLILQGTAYVGSFVYSLVHTICLIKHPRIEIKHQSLSKPVFATKYSAFFFNVVFGSSRIYNRLYNKGSRSIILDSTFDINQITHNILWL